MRRLHALVFVAALMPLGAAASKWKDALGAVQQAAQQPGVGGSLATLSNGEIAAGLKAALAQGTRTAVAHLGRTDGFWGNAAARIPLPKPIRKVEGLVRGIGMGASIDQLHLSLNRAAEQAVPVAAEVFATAVEKLTLDDVRGILTGPNDAATQYFKRTTSETLTARFRPLVAKATADVGLAQSYQQMVASAGPFAASLGSSADLDAFVTQKALDSLFVQVAAEEARIRENPAARTSDILRKVFGAKRT